MKYLRMPKNAWILAVVAAILIAAHGMVLYRLTSHLGWLVISALVLMVLLMHVGVFGPIYTFLKRRTRRS